MANIDISNPGSNKAALQAALGELTGTVLIDSGTISSPVEFLDITLPAGYMRFRIELLGYSFDTADSLAWALSLDGGTTFLNDNAHHDDYLFSFEEPGATTNGYKEVYSEWIAPFTIAVGANDAGNAYLDITPGDASIPPDVVEIDTGYGANTAAFSFAWVTLNPTPTTPVILARATTIRFAPCGNTDMNPPTSGENFIAGCWVLLGVPG